MIPAAHQRPARPHGLPAGGVVPVLPPQDGRHRALRLHGHVRDLPGENGQSSLFAGMPSPHRNEKIPRIALKNQQIGHRKSGK